MKKIIIVLSVFLFSLCVYADENDITDIAVMLQNYNSQKTDKSNITFKLNYSIDIEELKIPENSIVKAQVSLTKNEQRLKRNGYIICKLLGYNDSDKEYIDISNKNIYVTVRKYTPLDKKEFAIGGVETVATAAASHFIMPGAGAAYYFTKGAVQNKEDNRLKSGVESAYENSFLSYISKGEPLILNEGDEIVIKSIDFEKFEKMKEKEDENN